MARNILFFVNLVSLLLSAICMLAICFHKIPATIPEAIEADASGLSKEQVVGKLVGANVTLDHAYNLLWLFLLWWTGLSILNVSILVYTRFAKLPAIHRIRDDVRGR